MAYGVVGDTDIMKEAPMELIHAGFAGDVVGKITALWQIGLSWLKSMTNTAAETCVELVQRSGQSLAKGRRNATIKDDAYT